MLITDNYVSILEGQALNVHYMIVTSDNNFRELLQIDIFSYI